MPIPSQYNLPSPINEDEFEDMVEDYFKLTYDDAQRYGRKGQKQNGLDIIYTVNQGKEIIGIQCKKYSKLSNEDIDNIIKKTEGFPHSLTKLIIATTALRDVNIQNYVLEKKSNLKKEIQILFWEDIRPIIAGNNKLLKKYYSEIYNDEPKCETIKDLINDFNISISKYKIIEFLREDATGGMPSYLPSNVEMFVIGMNEKLDRMILLQKEEIFKDVKAFVNLLDDYNEYLGCLLHYNGNKYFTIQNNNTRKSLDKIKDEINEFKIKLNKIYSRINKGCSLYY